MIGTRLGNWVLEQELGRGAMGQVYRARRDPAASASDTPAPDEVAVKVLTPLLAQDPSFVERFRREIAAVGQLDHPHIVRFHESGVQDGVYFYAMEYVAGRNCGQLLRERGRFPALEVVRLAQQICSALKHAHDRGIVHRDLKPQNLLRTDDGTVKLTDFGVARVFTSRELTTPGGIIGTAEYLSPEQAAGKPATARSDLYSLGVVLYILLTGRLPFQGTTALDWLHKHRFAQFDRPQVIVPDLPRELDDIVCQLLEKDPAARPANAFVLLRQFESLERKLQRREPPTLAGPSVGDDVNLDFEMESAPPAASTSSPASAPHGTDATGNAARGPLLRRYGTWFAMLALCIGLMAWRMWPTSAAALFEQGAALMTSEDPADWDRAFAKYLDRLDRDFPGHPYGEQLASYREQIETHRAERQALKGMLAGDSASEAQLFYTQGLLFRKQGDLLRAQLTWQNLIWAFEGDAAEQQWVRLALKGLAELRERMPSAEQRLALVRRLLRHARPLPREQRDRQVQAIEYLYRDDPAILEEVRKYRAEGP